MAETLNQSPEEEKKIGLDEVREYFSNMPDFNDDPDLAAIIRSASQENFFDKVTTKDGKRVSAYDLYDLVVRDEAEYRRAEEEYGREGRQDKVNQYKERADYAAKVAEFLQSLAVEKRQNEIDEFDAERIIDAINTDLAKKIIPSDDSGSPEIPVEEPEKELPKPGDITPEVKEQIRTEAEARRKQEAEKNPKPEKNSREIIEAAPGREKKEREYDKLGRQISEFETAWKRANDLVKEKKSLAKKGLLPEIYKESLADINREFLTKSKEIIKLAGEMSGRNLIKDAKEELGLETDPKAYEKEEFKNLITKKAQEIYEKKSGLYNTAKRLLKGNLKSGQVKKIINEARESGKYGQNGEKINGRLILGKSGKYYFEIAGKTYPVVEARKLAKKESAGKPPSEADFLPVIIEPPSLSQEARQELPPQSESEQSQVTSEINFVPDVKPLPADDIRNVKLKFGTDREGKVIMSEQNQASVAEESDELEVYDFEDKKDSKKETPQPELPPVPQKMSQTEQNLKLKTEMPESTKELMRKMVDLTKEIAAFRPDPKNLSEYNDMMVEFKSRKVELDKKNEKARVREHQESQIKLRQSAAEGRVKLQEQIEKGAQELAEKTKIINEKLRKDLEDIDKKKNEDIAALIKRHQERK